MNVFNKKWLRKNNKKRKNLLFKYKMMKNKFLVLKFFFLNKQKEL